MGIFLVIFVLIEMHTMHQKWVETQPAQRSSTCNPNPPPHCDPWVKP